MVGVSYERGTPVEPGPPADPGAGLTPIPYIPHPTALQGYLAHKKQHSPLGLPQPPRHSPTVESWGGAVSYVRGTRVTPEC